MKNMISSDSISDMLTGTSSKSNKPIEATRPDLHPMIPSKMNDFPKNQNPKGVQPTVPVSQPYHTQSAANQVKHSYASQPTNVRPSFTQQPLQQEWQNFAGHTTALNLKDQAAKRVSNNGWDDFDIELNSPAKGKEKRISGSAKAQISQPVAKPKSINNPDTAWDAWDNNWDA